MRTLGKIRAALAMTVVTALAASAAGCSSGSVSPGGTGSPGGNQSSLKLPDLHGQHLELAAVWTPRSKTP